MGLEQYKGDVEMCCRCSACKFVPLQQVTGLAFANVCPSISKYNFHSYSAGGRMNIAAAMLKSGVPYTDKLRDIVYNCQMCGACGVSCNYAMDMEVMEPIGEFRIKCVEDGQTNPALETTIASLRQHGTMVPSAGRRGAWAAGLGLKDATKERVEVLYHVGCLTSFDQNRQKLAQATAAILKKAGVDFGFAGDAETCCGGRAYQMGYKDDFLAQARKNMALIQAAGVKTVVTSCADGYHAFKVLYDKFNLKGGLEVLHISEYIDRLMKAEESRSGGDLSRSLPLGPPGRALDSLGGKEDPGRPVRLRSSQDLPARYPRRLSTAARCAYRHSRDQADRNGPDQGIRLVLRRRRWRERFQSRVRPLDRPGADRRGRHHGRRGDCDRLPLVREDF